MSTATTARINPEHPIGGVEFRDFTPESRSTILKVARCSTGITVLKEEQKEACQTGWKNKLLDRYNVALIGNDVFSLGYLGLQGIGLLLSTIGKNPAFISFCSVCGVLSGVLMLGIGFGDFRAGCLKLKNGEPPIYGLLLAATGLCEIVISAVLLLSAISAMCCAFGCSVGGIVAINAFFVGMPWLLPLLLLIPSIISLIEIIKKYREAVKGQNIYAQIQMPQLLSSINSFISMAEAESSDRSDSQAAQLPSKELIKNIATFIEATYRFKFAPWEETDNAEQMAKKLLLQIKQKMEEKVKNEMLQKETEKLNQAINLLLKGKDKLTEEQKKFIRNRGFNPEIDVIKNGNEITVTLNGTGIVVGGVAVTQVTLLFNGKEIEECVGKNTMLQIFQEKYLTRKELDRDPRLEKHLDVFLSTQLEDLTSNMGLNGALHVSALISPMIHVLTMLADKRSNKDIAAYMKGANPLMEQRNFIEQIKVLKKDSDTWEKLLVIRLAIQLLYVAGFGISVAAIGMTHIPATGSIPMADLFNAIQNLVLSFANLVPLYVDIGHPFLRGLPLVAPNINVKRKPQDGYYTLQQVEVANVKNRKVDKNVISEVKRYVINSLGFPSSLLDLEAQNFREEFNHQLIEKRKLAFLTLIQVKKENWNEKDRELLKNFDLLDATSVKKRTLKTLYYRAKNILLRTEISEEYEITYNLGEAGKRKTTIFLIQKNNNLSIKIPQTSSEMELPIDGISPDLFCKICTIERLIGEYLKEKYNLEKFDTLQFKSFYDEVTHAFLLPSEIDTVNS